MTERQSYERRMEAQLHEYAEKIGHLVGRAEKTTVDLKAQIQADIERLREKQETTRQELARLRASSEDAWQDVKAGLERAWHDLKESVEQAVARFK